MAAGKYESKTHLLKDFKEIGILNEGYSSGYDSNSDPESDFLLRKAEENHISTSTLNHRYNLEPDTEDSDSDSDFCFSDFDDDDDDSLCPGLDDSFGDLDTSDSTRYTNISSLCNSLSCILAMPNLCDVTFYVGADRSPIHGVKAILSTRSKMFYQLILKATKEIEASEARGSKKQKSRRYVHGVPSKPVIYISDVQYEHFKKLVTFIHTGCIDIKPDDVVGLMLAASHYDVPDLLTICRDFIDRCCSVQSLSTISATTKHFPSNVLAQKISNRVVGRIDEVESKQRILKFGTETSV